MSKIRQIVDSLSDGGGGGGLPELPDIQAGDTDKVLQVNATGTGVEWDTVAGVQGPAGPQGPAGADGLDGAQGIQGPTGAPGLQGPAGIAGTQGPAGADGADGKSAYQSWLDAGNVGTEANFLVALKGATGDDGAAGPQGIQGPAGAAGSGNGVDNSVVHVSFPSGGSYHRNSSGGGATGAFKIELPAGAQGHSVHFRVNVFEYAGGKSFSVEVSGWVAFNAWMNAGAYVVGGNATSVDHAVRFGFEGGKACVWIGEITDQWNFPHVVVHSATVSFASPSVSQWESGWLVGLAVAFGTIAHTVTDTQLGKWVDGVQTGTGGAGTAGDSAYDLWIAEGNSGTVADFLASLVGAGGADGAQGPAGVQGPAGAAGANGAPGADGADGKSAYQVWLDAGNVGTEANFLASLEGVQGIQGPAGAQGIQGSAGADGLDGATGAAGATGPAGASGQSAYQAWLAVPNVGTEADFLASLVGADGAAGAAGPQGPAGSTGPAGVQGAQGIQGIQGPAGADGGGVPIGGATGQILTKASAADNDTAWGDAPAGGGGGSTGRNLLLNGGFQVWQRGASIANPAAGGYTADRWRCNSPVTGATISSVYAGGGEKEGFTALQVSSTDGGFVGIGQFVENGIAAFGKTVTFSYWARVIAGTCDTAPLFSASGNRTQGWQTVLNGNSTTLTTAWQKITATVTLPAVAALTPPLVAGNDALDPMIRLWPSAGAVVEVCEAKLELGSSATDFEYRTVAEEMAACYRYYEVTTACFQFWSTGSQLHWHLHVNFKNKKRVSPTLSVTSADQAGTNQLNVWPGGDTEELATLGCRLHLEAANSGTVKARKCTVIADAEI